MKKISFDGLSRNVLFDDDENIIWQERPNKFNYITSNNVIPLVFTIIWLSFDTIGIVSVTIAMKDPSDFLPLLFFFAIHMIPVWIWIGSAIKLAKEYKSINYILTNKKVIATNDKTTLKINYKDVSDVSFSEARISKRGDITIKGNGQPIKFCGLKNASKQYATIRLIIDNYQ